MIYCLFPCSTVSRLACPESLISRLYPLNCRRFAPSSKLQHAARLSTLHLQLSTKKNAFLLHMCVFFCTFARFLVDLRL